MIVKRRFHLSLDLQKKLKGESRQTSISTPHGPERRKLAIKRLEKRERFGIETSEYTLSCQDDIDTGPAGGGARGEEEVRQIQQVCIHASTLSIPFTPASFFLRLL